MLALRRALVRYHHRAIHVPRVERVAAALARLAGRAESLLDVGAGDGSIAARLGAAIGARRIAGVDVKVRPEMAIEVRAYDGATLPFDAGSFELVVLSDVLHHCADPAAVLRESLRVAARAVLLKDHYRFDAWSERVLLAMDVVGNAGPGVEVRGTYLSPSEWEILVREAGGRFASVEWPLRIHDLPWRIVTQDRLQFAARIEPRRAARPRPEEPRS